MGGLTNPLHLAFIAMIALIFLGPKKLPELARSLGHGMREFRESLSMESHNGDLPVVEADHPAAAAGSASAAPDHAVEHDHEAAAGHVPEDVAPAPGPASTPAASVAGPATAVPASPPAPEPSPATTPSSPAPESSPAPVSSPAPAPPAPAA